MEIDEAVNIIREEVDEDAEIIFGSSYDDSLSGRIRVSIVVTGIDEDAQVQAHSKNREFNKYVSLNEEPKEIEVVEEVVETVEEEVSEPVVAVVEEEVAPVAEEEVVELSNVVDLTAVKKPSVPVQEEFLGLTEEKPQESHQSSALFSAIMNKPVVANAEETEEVKTEMAEIKIEKPFAPTARVQIMEEEPPLFPEHGEVELPRERMAREETQAILNEEPAEPARQRFIDIILGKSRAKAKKPVKPVVVPKFDEIEEFADKETENDNYEDMEIPSFLRRRS
jgi:cell division protein FtsZ